MASGYLRLCLLFPASQASEQSLYTIEDFTLKLGVNSRHGTKPHCPELNGGDTAPLNPSLLCLAFISPICECLRRNFESQENPA